jgi:DNA modification methylase
VLAVAMEHGRRGIGCDLNPAYIALATARLESVTPTMFVA